METETDNSSLDEPKKKRKMFKGTWFLMVTALAVLCTYYVMIGLRQHKYDEKVSLKRHNDSVMISEKTSKVEVANLDSILDVSYLMGNYNPSKEISFALVDLTHGSREGLYIREEVFAAYVNMYKAALKDGVKLIIISAARSFDYQKGIWESKWSGKRLVEGKSLAATIPDPVERARIILKYSAMPGTSRHHWGTDIDLNSMDPKYYETEIGKKIYDWLNTHASEYGFGQPYCAKGEKRFTGYEEEKWHWSYLPIAKQCTDAYQKKVKYADITGFSGSETAEKLKVIEDFVLGINPDCK